MEIPCEGREAHGNIQFSGFHPLLYQKPPRLLHDGSQDPQGEAVGRFEGDEPLVEENQKFDAIERMVESIGSETQGTLQLLRYQWKLQMLEAVLLESFENNKKMDKQEESKEKYDMGEIPSVLGLESPATTEDLP